ncbi:hypothetical protein MESS2_980061 [Mesorhizobium metallidurans STM 2683]|uniref:Uncharacterized protein n=1 Tax=Mesorhizobium metallidurans STM 2683 TaxID=1297569 RepID=M5EZ50_9HYPH|nr:hypothetical protein MESS2_980061 [Mesorhizobium metallidurans STM 2683]
MQTQVSSGNFTTDEFAVAESDILVGSHSEGRLRAITAERSTQDFYLELMSGRGRLPHLLSMPLLGVRQSFVGATP